MRTTSRILGIIGSALAILLGGLSMLTALFPDSSFSGGFYFDDSFSAAALTAEPLPELSSSFWDNVDAAGFWLSCAAMVGGILGTAGSIIVTRRSSAAGALFIAASVISFITFVPTVLFIIAAVYALKKPQPAVQQMMPPGPYAGYPPAYPYAANPSPYPAAPPAAYPSPYPAAPPAAYPSPYPAAPQGAYPPPPGAYPPPPGAYPPPPQGTYPPPPPPPPPPQGAYTPPPPPQGEDQPPQPDDGASETPQSGDSGEA